MTDVADIPGQRREVAEPAAAEPPADPTASVPDRVAHVTGRVASQVVDRLRNSAEMAGDRGTTAIADEVVEKITGIAVRAVPGVYDTGGDVSRAFAAVRQRIGLGNADESTDRGISVKLDGTRARIDITLVIEYGFVVNTVTTQVRANVIGAVEKMLGLQVAEVNIVVDDVHVGEGSSTPSA